MPAQILSLIVQIYEVFNYSLSVFSLAPSVWTSTLYCWVSFNTHSGISFGLWRFFVEPALFDLIPPVELPPGIHSLPSSTGVFRCSTSGTSSTDICWLIKIHHISAIKLLQADLIWGMVWGGEASLPPSSPHIHAKTEVISFSIAVVVEKQRRFFVDNLMLGVQLADVLTRYSSHPQGKSETRCENDGNI